MAAPAAKAAKKPRPSLSAGGVALLLQRPAAPHRLQPPLVLQVMEVVDVHECGCKLRVVRVYDGENAALAVVDRAVRQFDMITALHARRAAISCQGCAALLARAFLACTCFRRALLPAADGAQTLLTRTPTRAAARARGRRRRELIHLRVAEECFKRSRALGPVPPVDDGGGLSVPLLAGVDKEDEDYAGDCDHCGKPVTYNDSFNSCEDCEALVCEACAEEFSGIFFPFCESCSEQRCGRCADMVGCDVPGCDLFVVRRAAVACSCTLQADAAAPFSLSAV